jgi:hypothetical protein
VDFVLPRVQAHGRVYFRHLKSSERKEDAVQEMVALAWGWVIRLARRGRDATRFPTALATFAACAVGSGRRLCGQERAKDVLSPRAQRRHGFAVSRLPEVETLSTNPFAEALADNTRSPVPDQAAFRLDFPAWLRRLGDRNRRIAEDMAMGHGTQALAARYGVSPARVSQLRREFHDDWERFTAGARSEAA